MREDDLDIDRSGRRSPSRWKVFAGLAVFIVLLVVAVEVRRKVEDDAALHRGPWTFEVDALPRWLPEGYSGRLQDLKQLPREVPLRAATWNADLRRAIEGNPWIRKVEQLERDGAAVRFAAIFERPVVALRGKGEYYLLDSEGIVIDVAPGDELAKSWGIAHYRPAFAVPKLRSGDRVVQEEVAELLSLVEVLWVDDIFSLYEHQIPELAAQGRPDGSLVWSILLANGTVMHWGRAPVSNAVAVLSVEAKLDNLHEAMDAFRADNAARPRSRRVVLNEGSRPSWR